MRVHYQVMKINNLKTQYQKNLLIGQTAACAVVIVLSLLLYLNRPEYVTIEPDRVNIGKLTNERINESGLMIYNRIPVSAEEYLHHSQARSELSELRCRLLEICRNRQLSYLATYNGPVYPIAGYGGDICLYPSGFQPAAKIINIQTDPNEMWPVGNQDKNLGSLADYNFNAFSRKVIKPPENRPMILEFARPRYPGGMRYNCDATVRLMVIIDEQGFIDSIATIFEEPSGFGFAKSVREALRDSYIEPAVVRGRKSGGRYILSYEFCRDCPAKPVVVESGDNIVVTTK